MLKEAQRMRVGIGNTAYVVKADPLMMRRLRAKRSHTPSYAGAGREWFRFCGAAGGNRLFFAIRPDRSPAALLAAIWRRRHPGARGSRCKHRACHDADNKKANQRSSPPGCDARLHTRTHSDTISVPL